MSVPTVNADSTPRQPICPFTVSRAPPFRLSFHLCASRCTTCVCLRSLWDSPRASWPSEWSHVRSAVGSVARVCQLTPLLLRTTPCRLSLLHHRGRGGGSVSLISYHKGSNPRGQGYHLPDGVRCPMSGEPSPSPLAGSLRHLRHSADSLKQAS